MENEEEIQPIDMRTDMLLDDVEEIVCKQGNGQNKEMQLSKEVALAPLQIPEVVDIEADDLDLNSDSGELHRLQNSNSKLRSDIADAKRSKERRLKKYENERSKRENLEKKCDELELNVALHERKLYLYKKDSQNMLEEINRLKAKLNIQQGSIQIKLEDAKIILESKYETLEHLRSQLEAFLKKNSGNFDTEAVNEAKFLLQEVSEATDMREDLSFLRHSHMSEYRNVPYSDVNMKS